MANRPLWRHGLGLAAAFLVASVLPFLARSVSSGVSAMLGQPGWAHFYSVDWNGSESQLDSSSVITSPWSPPLLFLVASTAVICTVAEIVQRRLSFLSWAFPPVLGALLGLVAGFYSRGGEIPPAVVFTMGVTVGFVALLLVGAYWLVLMVVLPKAKIPE